MNFDDAVAAHVKWKDRLNQFIDGTSVEQLKSDVVCKDNMCDLGKWIYGEGASFKAKSNYTALVNKHAHFHVCASDVVKKVEGNDKSGAKSLLDGAFAAASAETVSAIMALKQEAS